MVSRMHEASHPLSPEEQAHAYGPLFAPGAPLQWLEARERVAAYKQEDREPPARAHDERLVQRFEAQVAQAVPDARTREALQHIRACLQRRGMEAHDVSAVLEGIREKLLRLQVLERKDAQGKNLTA